MAASMHYYHSGGGAVVSTILLSVKNLKQSPTCHINRVFLPVKLTYFLYWAGSVSLLPFFPVYMSYLGLSAVQTGIIRGIEPFLDFLITPLWGALADKYSKHRQVLLFTMVTSGIFYSSTYFVPHAKQEGSQWIPLINSTPVALGFNSRTESDLAVKFTNKCASVIVEQSKIAENPQLSNQCYISRTGEIFCCEYSSNQSTSLTNALVASKGDTSILKGFNIKMGDATLTFILMMILIFAAKSCYCTTGPIMDAVAMALAQEHNGDYGKQRVWGAISWGFFAAISGAAVDACNKSCPTKHIYAPAFGMFAGFVILSILTTCKVKFHNHTSPDSISRNICPLLRNPHILVFLLILFIVGISVGVISTYLFLFLQELHGPHSLMGLTLTISCISEVPFMYYSSKILERFGHRCIFYLCLACYGIRFVVYSMLHNPWLVLPVELLHGLCYGAFWPTSTSYCNLIAPQGMEATVQTVAFAVNCGFGEGIGTLVGGVIYHMFGGRLLFRATAVMCAVTLLACLLLHWCLNASWPSRQTRIHNSVQYESI